jgi:hypothetical protein
MKKTAMQIMLDELLSHGYKIPFHLVVKCKELLEMEKEQIIIAYDKGEFNQGCNGNAEQYYNKKYGANK